MSKRNSYADEIKKQIVALYKNEEIINLVKELAPKELKIIGYDD